MLNMEYVKNDTTRFPFLVQDNFTQYHEYQKINKVCIYLDRTHTLDGNNISYVQSLLTLKVFVRTFTAKAFHYTKIYWNLIESFNLTNELVNSLIWTQGNQNYESINTKSTLWPPLKISILFKTLHNLFFDRKRFFAPFFVYIQKTGV